MNRRDDILATPGRLVLSGAPQGVDARLIGKIAAQNPVLHIARDDARLATMADALRFFAPGLDLVILPAWDCLPYDRVSPNPTLAAQRLQALDMLARREAGAPGVILTTASAALQRMPPRAIIRQASLTAHLGETISPEALIATLAANGYGRADTVMEAGEFAVRGGILDIFPPGADQPVRLDFFGDVLDGIRRFDPLTQRTTGRLEAVGLAPVSEVLLSDETVARFRAGYRALFGAAQSDDPLYQAVSEKRKYQGMEHWLALFYERLESLFDYVPEALVTLDYLAEEALGERQEMITDYYQARRSETGSYGAVFKPVPPERLYLTGESWREALASRRTRVFTPHEAPADQTHIDLGGRPGRDFAPERTGGANVYDALREHLAQKFSPGRRLIIATYSAGARDRLKLVLADHGLTSTAAADDWPACADLAPNRIALVVLRLEAGFEADDGLLITEQDLLGDRLARQTRRSRRAENFITEASALTTGDLVVHLDHGIGRYRGLQTITVSGAPHDCLELEYDGGDKLFVPVENIEVLSRYGSGDMDVALDKLGGIGWQSRKARLKKRIRDMADDLIRIAAARALRQAEKITPTDGLFEEFCARFPYQETDDQARAIDAVIDDLASGAPMDRLICGDVGFGKTEVALRSAFVTALSGRQVALITPTTLLCRQHFKTFCERFQGLPVRIAQLSRLVSAKQAAQTREEMKSGQLDIVIGTHALLGKTISFKDLGLLIIDEEQHFGVAHKERLKQLRANVHVLTLTATPIPRTLQLAMSGLRELSLIATPPVDRLAVRTFVLSFDGLVVREALLREHYRGGQSFYVCPRISDLPEAERFLRETVPEIKLAIAHGQMPARQLEDVMNAFYDGAYDVLLSTTIIESGLDIPTANTLVVHRADMFGLAQLYQLRGRIGRSKLRAYAYLTVPARCILSEAAEKRLKVLQSLDTLGAGFSLASHDLDIRGAGNLLGEEQSGHIREVGVELYQHMLEEAVAQARAEKDGAPPAGESWSPQVNLGTSVLIPEHYVADLAVRLGLYRRIAGLEERQEIEDLAAELIDRFGPLPEEVENLIRIVTFKHLCRAAGIEKIEAGPHGATLAFRDNHFANPAGLVAFIAGQSGTAKLRPDHRLVYMRDWSDVAARFAGADYLLKELAKIAGQGQP